MSALREQSASEKLKRFQHGEGRFTFAPDEFEEFHKKIAASTDLYRKLAAVDTLLRACARLDEYSERALASFDHLIGGRLKVPGVYYPGNGGLHTCTVELPSSERLPKTLKERYVRLLALGPDADRAIVHGNTGYTTPFREFAAVIDTSLPDQTAEVYYHDHTEHNRVSPGDRYIGNLLVEQLQAHDA